MVSEDQLPDRRHGAAWVCSEYWLSDAGRYEAWEPLRARLAITGRRLTKDYIGYHLTGHLLDDVIIAAGGVEAAILRLRAAQQQLAVSASEHVFVDMKGVPHGLGHEAAVDAWYAFADLLSWSRAVIERLDRRAASKKFPSQGLIHAVRPKRLKKCCEAVLDELRRGPVGQSRPLANFMLHAALVRNPFSGAQVTASGLVTLPIPDLPPSPVSHWYLLTWRDERDGFEFAEELWEALQAAIDDLVLAFEQAVPRRMRRQ